MCRYDLPYINSPYFACECKNPNMAQTHHILQLMGCPIIPITTVFLPEDVVNVQISHSSWIGMRPCWHMSEASHQHICGTFLSSLLNLHVKSQNFNKQIVSGGCCMRYSCYDVITARFACFSAEGFTYLHLFLFYVMLYCNCVHLN